MDDEELEKSGDTQTSADDTKAADNSENKDDLKDTNNGEQKDNDAKDNDDKGDDEVANAFGNKSEIKNEGDKGKKTNTVAKKNTDGSITFKNQEELNGFIDRMVAKGAKKAEVDFQSKSDEEENSNQNNDTNKNAQDNTNVTENSVATPNYSADIALSMIEAGADSSKARRAARLVDTNKVIVNGQLDEVKLKEEVESILSEFPEFKNSQTTESTDKGFKFGAGKQAYTDSNEDLISDIFGNKQ